MYNHTHVVHQVGGIKSNDKTFLKRNFKQNEHKKIH